MIAFRLPILYNFFIFDPCRLILIRISSVFFKLIITQLTIPPGGVNVKEECHD